MPSPNPLILCVDDETIGLGVRRTLLERAGYRVLTALNGDLGLKLFTSETVEAVILDYSMPGMSGAEVAREMRLRKPEIPILLLSAYVDLPRDLSGIVDIYMTKGEGALVLLEKLRTLVARSPQPTPR